VSSYVGCRSGRAASTGAASTRGGPCGAKRAHGLSGDPRPELARGRTGIEKGRRPEPLQRLAAPPAAAVAARRLQLRGGERTALEPAIALFGMAFEVAPNDAF